MFKLYIFILLKTILYIFIYIFRNFDEILQKISCTVINNLKCCENIAINNNLCTIIITDNYLMLAQYCLEELNDKGTLLL